MVGKDSERNKILFSHFLGTGHTSVNPDRDREP